MYQRRGRISPQERAKPLIANNGKPIPTNPKKPVNKNACQRQPEAEIARQQLEQRADGQIGQDEQAGAATPRTTESPRKATPNAHCG